MSITRIKIARWLGMLLTASLSVSFVGMAKAQVVEQNRPQLLTGQQLTGLPEGAPRTSGAPSDAPLGANLLSLVFLDKPQNVDWYPRLVPGIGVGGIKILQGADFKSAMQPFLNRPLSQKLIAEIRDAVVTYYRAKNRPLVTVTVWPQEVTKGVLQLVVTQFRIGEIKTSGNLWTSDEYIRRNIRLKPGDEIAANELVEDANWLNLNPYRNLTAVFEPGAKSGETNLTLRSREVKPWTVYAGYANSGTPSTNRNRIILGFNTANLPLTDQQFAYQLTTSPDAWYTEGDLFGNIADADYVSHSATYFVPLPWRHKLNFQASYVRSNASLTDPFTQTSKTVQAYGEYAVPLSTSGAFRAEIYAGVDFKNQESDLFFAGALTTATTLSIAQGVVGARAQISSRLGVTSLDIRGIFSPGNLLNNNDDAAFVAATTNPGASSTYSYFYGKLNQLTPIFGTGFDVVTNLSVQLSDKALPGIEQLAMGGARTVRGYNELEVSGDSGVIISNELRAPGFEILGRASDGITDRAVLFGFFDYGYVEDRFAGTTQQLAGVGAGVDYSLNKYFQASLSLGRALKNGIRTDNGKYRGNFSVTASY